jgi:8-oxo-dGTP pyrophosphatase MutT (NUDIX family)
MTRIRVQSIVVQDGNVLFGYGKGVHFFPGGQWEDGETAEEAALRELREEANVEGTVLFDIVEPEIKIHQTPDSLYDRHVTFLVDIGDQTPAIGYDPEEADTGENVSLAGIELVPIKEPGRFTWIDIRYFAALASECDKRGAIYPWLDDMKELLRLWRVK